jgi:chorismate mutase/prephenate dehydratase
MPDIFTDIPQVRKRIDQIDNTVLDLLKERIGCAKRIGELKNNSNKAAWDPQREKEIYDRLRIANNNTFPETSMLSIFHEIITTCRLSQEQTAVAYLGPEATFTHLAGVKYFGHTASYNPVETIDDVFSEVDRERTNYGIVPVENSIEGAVFSTLDSFMKYQVKICGEVHMRIHHNLVNQSGRMTEIKKIVSHAQPLAQCREWLRKHCPQIETLPVFSTGLAAQMAANDPTVAAIASSLATKTYDLQPVVKGIEDFEGNTTRFLVIGKRATAASGKDKTSLLLGLADKPGALSDILLMLSKANINLVKIESRPIKGKQWEYLFFIDLTGHIDEPKIKDGCKQLKQMCSYYEWLGSYPSAS